MEEDRIDFQKNLCNYIKDSGMFDNITMKFLRLCNFKFDAEEDDELNEEGIVERLNNYRKTNRFFQIINPIF